MPTLPPPAVDSVQVPVVGAWLQETLLITEAGSVRLELTYFAEGFFYIYLVEVLSARIVPRLHRH